MNTPNFSTNPDIYRTRMGATRLLYPCYIRATRWLYWRCSFDRYGIIRTLRLSFQAWIFRIATNEALRLLGRQKGDMMLSLDDVTADMLGTKTDTHFDSSDTITMKLQQAILHLPAKQQLAFNLRYYDEMSYDEIAEVAGSTAVDVYKQTTGACGGIDFWGNCWEWTSTQTATGEYIVKGGAWDSSRDSCRSEYSDDSRDGTKGYANVGFRVVRVGR